MQTRKLQWNMLPVIFALAWPTMLEQLLQTAVQYIDTAMVGSLGTDATAAVGATATVNWLINGSVSALAIGFLPIIAQSLGAGDPEKARRAAAQTVPVTLFAGLFFTALTLSLSPFVPIWMQVDVPLHSLAAKYFFILYAPMLPRAATIIFGTVLRAAGDTKTPMRVGVLVNLLNVLLNFLLIYPTREVRVFSRSVTVFGADLGVIGAGLASAVAFTVGGICITVALWRHPTLSPRGQSLRPDKKILAPALRVAIPNMLQRFGTSLGYVVFAAMINSVGEVATAAHTIANTVESAFYIPGYGMQTAAATLTGNAIGEGDKQKMRDFSSMMLFCEVTLMCLSGGLLFAFAPQMMGLFSDATEVILLGATVLRMVALSEPFYGVSIIIEGMLQGAGNTKVAFAFNLVGMWGVRIVGTFICTQLLSMGLISAWACMILHNLLLFCAFVVYHRRMQ